MTTIEMLIACADGPVRIERVAARTMQHPGAAYRRVAKLREAGLVKGSTNVTLTDAGIERLRSELVESQRLTERLSGALTAAVLGRADRLMSA